MILARRSFLSGLAATLVTAPAIVRAGSLMPVKVIIEKPLVVYGSSPCMDAIPAIRLDELLRRKRLIRDRILHEFHGSNVPIDLMQRPLTVRCRPG